MTYTTAAMQLSKAAYDEIKERMLEAGYHHVFDGSHSIDMSGVSVEPDLAHVPNQELRALADRIDYERLWARSGLERSEWTQEMRDRCDAGVMLRRYASLLSENLWRIYPPQPGLSFVASTLEKAVEMASKHRERNDDSGDQVLPTAG